MPTGNFHHYLPISDALLHGGFYVTSAGCATIQPGKVYPPNGHPSLYSFSWKEGRTLPEFSVMLISEGAGVIETHETGRTTFNGPAVILLQPGVWHRYRPAPETGWKEKWVHFNGEFAHQLLDQKILPSDQLVLFPEDFSLMETLLDRLLDAARNHPSANSLHLSLVALGALAAVLENISQEKTPTPAKRDKSADPLVVAAIDYIWARSHHVLSVTDIADALGVTRRKLERHMMDALGRSVLDAIVDCRFSRAERLLRETDLGIKTVASLAGFGSVQNLRQVFLDRAGCAPGIYRERHLSRKVAPGL